MLYPQEEGNETFRTFSKLTSYLSYYCSKPTMLSSLGARRRKEIILLGADRLQQGSSKRCLMLTVL